MYLNILNLFVIHKEMAYFWKAGSPGGMAPGTGGLPKGMAPLNTWKQSISKQLLRHRSPSYWQIECPKDPDQNSNSQYTQQPITDVSNNQRELQLKNCSENLSLIKTFQMPAMYLIVNKNKILKLYQYSCQMNWVLNWTNQLTII